MVDKITSVPRERIGARIGAIGTRELERVDSAAFDITPRAVILLT